MSKVIANANADRDLRENNPAQNPLILAKKQQNGFLSTLASYLTSTAKSDPKPVAKEKRKLMNSWDEVDLVRLNRLVCNVLYEHNSYERLIAEIERVAGQRREHCFYGLAAVVLALVLLHDAIGAITAFVTLILPAFMTVTTISSPSSYENPSILKAHQDFYVQYWTVYAVFVTLESFVASLIQWDLRMLRLVFMTMCLSTRVPVLAMVHSKILTTFSKFRDVVEKNNYEATMVSNKSS